MKPRSWFLSVTLLLLTSCAWGKPMVIAVGDFNTAGASYSVGQSVIAMLSSRLEGLRGVQLVERRRLDAVARQQHVNLSGLVDQKNATSIGKLVGARYYIQGAVSHFGVLTLLTARLIDVERAAVVAGYQSITDRGEAGIPLAVRTLATDIATSLTGKAPTGKAKKDYRQFLYDALALYNQGKYRRSLSYWDKMLALNPKNGTLRFIAASMYYSIKRYRDSELSAKEALTYDPASAEAALLVGKCLFMRGKYYEATDYLEKAVKLRPELAEPHFLIGQAYKNRGRLEDAMESFSIAIDRDPQYVPAYGALGQMLLEAARFDLARKVLTRAVELDGDNPNLRFLLGTTLALDDRDKEARRQLEILRTMDPPLAAKLEEILQ